MLCYQSNSVFGLNIVVLFSFPTQKYHKPFIFIYTWICLILLNDLTRVLTATYIFESFTFDGEEPPVARRRRGSFSSLSAVSVFQGFGLSLSINSCWDYLHGEGRLTASGQDDADWYGELLKPSFSFFPVSARSVLFWKGWPCRKVPSRYCLFCLLWHSWKPVAACDILDPLWRSEAFSTSVGNRRPRSLTSAGHWRDEMSKVGIYCSAWDERKSQITEDEHFVCVFRIVNISFGILKDVVLAEGVDEWID